MFKMSGRVAVLGFAAMCVSSLAAAEQPPSTGLGEAWPATTDVSQNPHYHVYLFVRDGIRYFQVNELNGTVDAAVAAVNGTILPLPIGRTADQVKVVRTGTPSAQNANGASPSQTVYRDAATTIPTTPLANGTSQVAVAETCTDPDRCSG